MSVYSHHPWLAIEVLVGVAVLLPPVASLVGLDVGPALTSAFLFGPVLGVLVAVDGLVRLRRWLGSSSTPVPPTRRRLVGVGVRVVEFTLAVVYLLALGVFYLAVQGTEPGRGEGAGLSLFIVGLVGGVALAFLVVGRATARLLLGSDGAEESPPPRL